MASSGSNPASPDSDSDGICDATDNCPDDSNPLQEDLDFDNVAILELFDVLAGAHGVQESGAYVSLIVEWQLNGNPGQRFGQRRALRRPTVAIEEHEEERPMGSENRQQAEEGVVERQDRVGG